MKKIYSFLAAFALCANAFAQDETSLTSKKGTPILPEEKEFAIGISANQFLNYVTRGAANPSFTYVNNPSNVPVALFGKKMLNANTALRARFALNAGANTQKAIVFASNISPDPLAPSFNEDWRTVTSTDILLAGGYENRRGKGRLQGVYGGEFLFGVSGNRVKYQYGNAITQDFNAPETTNFAGNVNNANGFSRVLTERNSANLFIGARAFAGVEYFFAPKISIGGEFGYTLGGSVQGKGIVTTETWDSAAGSVRKIETEVFRNGGFTSLRAGVDNLNGAINVLFYF
jgi:hypothetical protein